MNKEVIVDFVSTAKEIALALVPGALGASVAIAVQGAMSWTQRFIQLAVGIIVSYYAGEAAAEIFALNPATKNGIGFTFGIGAMEVVRNLRSSLGDLAKDAPRDIWEAIKKRFKMN